MGLLGSMINELTPVVWSTYKTFCQDLPPSMVRKTPRSGFGPQPCPMAPTKTMSELFGSITILEICPTSFNPMNRQLAPPSGERKTPCPVETSLRMLDSPVPTHTRFGLDGASAIAPIEATGCFSKMGFQLRPPSCVLKTPPAAAPT